MQTQNQSHERTMRGKYTFGVLQKYWTTLRLRTHSHAHAQTHNRKMRGDNNKRLPYIFISAVSMVIFGERREYRTILLSFKSNTMNEQPL